MTEKYEINKSTILKGSCCFSLNFLGATQEGFKTSFVLKVHNSERCYETSSDIFVGDTMYNALLRAYVAGKSALQKNKCDVQIADQAFGLYVEKAQLKLPFGGPVL